MHDKWPQGDTLDAAARRGDLIREMMRERGYTSVVAIMSDILASVEVEEARERSEWAERTAARGAMVRGRTLHTLSPREAADSAVEEVEWMTEQASK